MKKSHKCNEIIQEVEELRVELTKVRDKYHQICERLWMISNKKRGNELTLDKESKQNEV